MSSKTAVVRSLAFHALFYPYLTIAMLLTLPILVLPRRTLMKICQAWSVSALALHRVVIGVRCDWRGQERVPPGALLVAAKHQSTWETLSLITRFDDPAFVLKRELMWIPLFGWWLKRMKMIPIDRRKGSETLAAMSIAAAEAIAEGRQVLIFPEGTRREAGAPPAYKFGIARLYTALDCPCLPVALNSGMIWPRRQFVQRPGTLIVEFLPLIPPGRSARSFFRELQHTIEDACDRLMIESAADNAEDLPPSVRARLAELAAA
ncbi:lysophospholipid acyltransferase family protein [Methylobrevis albus]|uniref:1-acyl-sn-glycerol-3-phosphate acyltransferase n=1 Tax=Methylobrevis albus TaxID=2793297 RepID=A0A931MYN8_9HYPH|nr:lysophospholipid acyltransferase family protein [Methylobrevis albus]MBH0237204.1 1-acyl-sn-glycerol-3-phosphate acyltransferase [Methylobrevis albus]